jgi:Skp family chaperone for outer membrane proteins
VQVAIDNVAKEKGYTYIFDASMGLILYADPSTEVTALVKAKLGL